MKTKKYWAFISYSSADRKTAEWLQKSLEGFSIPKGIAGMTVSDGTEIGRHLQSVFRKFIQKK